MGCASGARGPTSSARRRTWGAESAAVRKTAPTGGYPARRRRQVTVTAAANSRIECIRIHCNTVIVFRILVF